MSGSSQPSQGSLGSQPECWEEPAGIMDSIVGIIPRNTPQRATSFSGLLNIPDDAYASGPPTPYDNSESSPPEEIPSNLALPTFSFLKLDVEQNRRNINLSKLWELNPLVSLPPPASSSSIDLKSTESMESAENSGNVANETNNINEEPIIYTNNYNNSQSTNTDDDESEEIASPPKSTPLTPPVAATTSTSTSPVGRKRGPYNTRNRKLAAAQAAQAAGQTPIEEETGIQRKRRRGSGSDSTEVPTSEPDPPTSPPPRRPRGGSTPKRGRGARSGVSPSPVASPPANIPAPATAVPVVTPALIHAPIPIPTPTPTPIPTPAPASVLVAVPTPAPQVLVTPSSTPSPVYTSPTTPIIPTTAPSSSSHSVAAPVPSIVASQIKNLEVRLEVHEKDVDDMRALIASHLAQDHYDSNTSRQHEKLSAAVRATHADVDQLLHSVVLEPADIVRLRSMRENASAMIVRLRVMWRELSLYSGTASNSGDAASTIAALVIREQPAPKVFFKVKDAKDLGKVTVELITPCKIRCEILTPVTANLFSNSDGKKEVASIKALINPIINHTQDVDSNMMAIFEQLKLNASTRMICTNMRFSMSMKTTGPHNDKPKLHQIESDASSPFIVITNESQWPEAAGKLLYADAFDGYKVETSWAYYANMLQFHFMTVTNQNVDNPTRKLYPWELQYIHSRFGYRATLTKDATEKFWNFFGPVLLSIHFKRKIYEMWKEGLIYGLISKDECSTVLCKQKEGTFLIRFSESIPGAFAIAYVTDSASPQDKVRHYLVKSDDLGANKTLPDYLRERDQFVTLLRLEPSSKILEPVSKDEALELYYSKRAGLTAPGYVVL